jgi:hypothetical protein
MSLAGSVEIPKGSVAAMSVAASVEIPKGSVAA